MLMEYINRLNVLDGVPEIRSCLKKSDAVLWISAGSRSRPDIA